MLPRNLYAYYNCSKGCVAWFAIVVNVLWDVYWLWGVYSELYIESQEILVWLIPARYWGIHLPQYTLVHFRDYADGTRIHTLGTVKMEIYLRGTKIDHEVWVAKDALRPTLKPFFVITRIQVSFTWEDLKLTRTVQYGGTEVVGSERTVRYDGMLQIMDQSRAVCWCIHTEDLFYLPTCHPDHWQ